MKIKVNGKQFEFGKAHGHQSCNIGFDKACELVGCNISDVEEITYKHKTGESGQLIPGVKVVAFEGTAFVVRKKSDK